VGLFGSIGKIIGGAITGFVGGGFNPIGAIIGGIGGLLSGGGGGGSVSYQAYIPPYAQKGADILTDLLEQTPEFAQITAYTKRPYIKKALRSFESIPTDISNIFGRAKGEISNLYEDTLRRGRGMIASDYEDMLRRGRGMIASDYENLFRRGRDVISSDYENLLARVKDIIISDQAKQNLKLGALGILNTQAQQWTLNDILNRTAFDVLRSQTEHLTRFSEDVLKGGTENLAKFSEGALGEKTRHLADFTESTLKGKTETLANLIGSEAQTLLQHLFAQPDFYSSIADEFLQTDPRWLERQEKLDIAKSLMGVPTYAQPYYKKGLVDYLSDIVKVGQTVAGISKDSWILKKLLGG
jgi:hypothetical protein